MLLKRIVLFCLLLFSLLPVGGCGSQAKHLQVGDAAPAFSAKDITGKVVSLKELKGKAVVLRFFLPDCKFCKADTAVFNRYYQQYRDKGLEIIYIDTSPDKNEVEKFAKDLGIQFPVIHDENGEIAGRYMIKAVPQTIILSPALVIKGAILGGVSEAELNQLLGPYLDTSGSPDGSQHSAS